MTCNKNKTKIFSNLAVYPLAMSFPYDGLMLMIRPYGSLSPSDNPTHHPTCIAHYSGALNFLLYVSLFQIHEGKREFTSMFIQKITNPAAALSLSRCASS